MMKAVKVGVVSVVVAVVAAIVVITYPRHPSAAVASNSSAQGTSGSSLQVTSSATKSLQSDDGAITGQSLSGDVSATSLNGSSANSSGTVGLPAPTDFGQYDQYKTASRTNYIDVVLGSGPAVKVGSKVTVNYRGYLTNGTEIDETYDKNQPFTFTEASGDMITGWLEGMLGMQVGGTRRLIIPPSVGYGDTANGPVPADSVLVFDVELVSVSN